MTLSTFWKYFCRCPNSSREHANTPRNRPEENDETDSESFPSRSQIASSGHYRPVAGNCCSSDHFGQFSSSSACSTDFSKGVDSTNAATPFQHLNNYCGSPARYVENWHGPCSSFSMGGYTSEPADNSLLSTGMARSPQNGSIVPPSSVSLHGTLGLTHLEPGYPLVSYQVRPHSPVLQQSSYRPGVSVYVPEPRRLPARADHNPFGTPGYSWNFLFNILRKHNELIEKDSVPVGVSLLLCTLFCHWLSELHWLLRSKSGAQLLWRLASQIFDLFLLHVKFQKQPMSNYFWGVVIMFESKHSSRLVHSIFTV